MTDVRFPAEAEISLVTTCR